MAREVRGNEVVTASFDGMESARRAITALEQAGIEGHDIVLEGPGERRVEREPHVRQRDAGVARELSRWGLLGGAIGLVLGALIGLLAGYLLFGTDGWAIWAMVVGMAGVGLATGGLALPTWFLPQQPQFDETYEEGVQPGEVRVAVRTGDETVRRRATDVLVKQHPLRIHVVRGSAGRPGRRSP